MKRRMLCALASATLLAAGAAGPAAAASPDWVEPGMGQPNDPPCQGEDRSTRAQSEPGRQGELARNLATESEYGVGDNVTAHHTSHGSCV